MHFEDYTPLKSLGGRSPYQVVTGLIPRLPRVLLAEGPLGVLSPNEYVDRLTRYLKSCYDDIQRHQREIREDEEAAGSSQEVCRPSSMSEIS